MERSVLRVRMSREEIMMPATEARNRMPLPRQVLGEQSPYPTVPIVIMTHHRLLRSSPSWLPITSFSLMRTISERVYKSEMKISTRETSGELLNTHFMPNYKLLRVPQMRQIRLPRGDRKMEDQTNVEKIRQALSSIRIYRISFTSVNDSIWQTGSLTLTLTPFARQFGWESTASNSKISPPLIPPKFIWMGVNFTSCLSASFIFSKCLKQTAASRLKVMAEWKMRMQSPTSPARSDSVRLALKRHRIIESTPMMAIITRKIRIC